MLDLMRININSKEHKKNHVVISKKDFNAIINDNPLVEKFSDLLLAALKRIDDPANIESEGNAIIRVIEYAIYFTSEPPFSTLIFTTKEKVDEYKENKRFQGIKEVKVKTDNEACILIKDYCEMSLDKEYY